MDIVKGTYDTCTNCPWCGEDIRYHLVDPVMGSEFSDHCATCKTEVTVTFFAEVLAKVTEPGCEQ